MIEVNDGRFIRAVNGNHWGGGEEYTVRRVVKTKK